MNKQRIEVKFLHSISNSRTEWLIVIAALILLSYFPIFSFLGTLPLRIWDESRLAVSAVEMVQKGNPIEVTYLSEPDLWNTKPPLLIWLQAISIKLLGVNELAVRLPSAISAFLTCIILLLFTVRHSGNIWLSAISILILITSQGYISLHGTRTADYDSLLVLNITAYSLCFFHFIETGNKKYLKFFFLFLILAVLTKGIAGLLILPGIALFTVLNKNLSELVKLKEMYTGAGLFLLVIGFYYGIREMVNPGYITAVIQNEITGRYLTDLEGHKEPFLYYFNNLISYRYSSYFPVIIVALIGNFFLTDRRLARISAYCSLISLVFLLIISCGISKMEHYELPIYPFFALVLGIFIYSIFKLIESISLEYNLINGKLLSIAFLFLFFYKPYIDTININVNPKDEGSAALFYSPGHALKKIINDPKDFNELTIVYSGYRAHLEFYRYMLREKGIQSSFTNVTELQTGDHVLFPNQEELNKLSSEFSYEEVFTEKFAKLVRIYKIKSIRHWSGSAEITPLDMNCYQSCHPWTLQKLTDPASGETALSAFTDFEYGMNCNEFMGHADSSIAFSGKTSAYMNREHVYSASFRCTTKPFEQFDLIEVSGKIKTVPPESRIHVSLSIDIKGKNMGYYGKPVKLDNVPGIDGWYDFATYISPRHPYQSGSEMLIYLHLESGDKVNLDDLRIVFMKSDKK